MNILYFHPHFTYPGGAGKFVLETGERLANMGHNVTVLAQSGDNEIIKNYPHINFKFIGGPLPNTISHWIQFPILMKRVFEVTKGMDIDVIFPQVFPANYWGFLFKRKHPEIPCVWYSHDLSAFIHQMDWIRGLKDPIKTMAIISNPIMKLIDQYLVRNVDRILTNSIFTSEFIYKTYNINSEIIYSGVDTTSFKPSTNIKKNMFAVSRLNRVKKIDQLITAMIYIRYAHLYIGGDGEDKERLISLSKKLGVDDRVIFLGKLTDEKLKYYYSMSKIVLFPSINEPFGIVPLEAMSSGTPVIASKSGGVVDTIINGKTGYLIKPNDVNELVSKIEYLLENDQLCIQMSQNARKHVEENFTWDITTNKLHEYFMQIKNM